MRRFRWLFVWLIQIAAMAVLGALAALSLWASRALYGICIWGLMPLAGCVSLPIRCGRDTPPSFRQRGRLRLFRFRIMRRRERRHVLFRPLSEGRYLASAASAGGQRAPSHNNKKRNQPLD